MIKKMKYIPQILHLLVLVFAFVLLISCCTYVNNHTWILDEIAKSYNFFPFEMNNASIFYFSILFILLFINMFLLILKLFKFNVNKCICIVYGITIIYILMAFGCEYEYNERISLLYTNWNPFYLLSRISEGFYRIQFYLFLMILFMGLNTIYLILEHKKIQFNHLKANKYSTVLRYILYGIAIILIFALCFTNNARNEVFHNFVPCIIVTLLIVAVAFVVSILKKKISILKYIELGLLVIALLWIVFAFRYETSFILENTDNVLVSRGSIFLFGDFNIFSTLYIPAIKGYDSYGGIIVIQNASQISLVLTTFIFINLSILALSINSLYNIVYEKRNIEKS